MTTIGARVRELRQARGLSQQALACEGISPGYVSLIESGKRTPSAATAQLLAERLGVPVDRLVEDPRPLASDTARVEANFARLALANGDPAEAVRCLAKIDLDQLDSRTACDAALVLAESLQETGQLDRAVGVLETLIDRCRRDGSWVTLAIAAASLAVMYIESGDISRSIDTARLAVQEIEEAGLEGTEEHLRLSSVLVFAHYERGDLLYATRCSEELIALADRVGSARARGSVYWNAAVVAHSRGRTSDAITLTDRAVALLGEQDESRDLPRLRLHYAWLLLNHEAPQAEQALAQLDRAETDLTLAGSQLDLGTAAAFRGRAYLVLGRVEDAAEQAARALQLLGPSEHIERVGALILLGDVGTAQYHLDLALESFGEAELVLSGMKPSRATARLWRELGDAWRDHGDSRRAIAAYEHSFRIVGLAPRPVASRLRAMAH
jgi:transcriptional regulator with XRE-family HTH domain